MLCWRPFGGGRDEHARALAVACFCGRLGVAKRRRNRGRRCRLFRGRACCLYVARSVALRWIGLTGKTARLRSSRAASRAWALSSPGEFKILTSSDGSNFAETTCWKAAAREDVSYVEQAMFDAPVAAQAVSIVMRSPRAWGYFGLLPRRAPLCVARRGAARRWSRECRARVTGLNNVALMATPGPSMLARLRPSACGGDALRGRRSAARPV